MTVLANRVRVLTSTLGTGTVTLDSSAISDGYCSFSEAGVLNGDTVSYVIEEGNDFEIGTGVYSSTGPTLTRTTVRLSKIGGVASTSKMDLQGGATVRIDAVKEDLFYNGAILAAGAVLQLTGGGSVTLGTTDAVYSAPANIFDFGTGNGGKFEIMGSVANANGPMFVAYHDRATPAANDYPGGLQIAGRDSAANTQVYGEFVARIVDPTSASEDSAAEIWIMSGGTEIAALTIDGTAPDLNGIGRVFAVFDAGANIDFPFLGIKSTDPSAAGPYLLTYHDSASPAATDAVGGWNVVGQNSAAAAINYFGIDVTILDPTAGSEDSSVSTSIQSGGASLQPLLLGSDLGGGFNYNYGHSFDLGSTEFGGVTIHSSTAAANGPGLTLYANSASPAASDVVGFLHFLGRNSAAGQKEYAGLTATILDPTSTSEDAKLALTIKSGGSNLDALTLGTTTADHGLGPVYAHVFDFGSASFPGLFIQSSNADANGAYYSVYRNSASPAASDTLGGMLFYGRNSTPADFYYGGFAYQIADPTAGSEDSLFFAEIYSGGSSLQALTLDGTKPTTLNGNAVLALFNAGATDWGSVAIQNSAATDAGAYFVTYQNSASPAANDSIGGMQMLGKDSAGNIQEYCDVSVVIVDPTSTSEDSKLQLSVVSGGSMLSVLTLGANNLAGSAYIGHQFNVGANFGGIEIHGNDPGNSGTLLSLFGDSASPAANDYVGNIWFMGRNSAAAAKTYGEADVFISDPTAGLEASGMQFWIQSAGTEILALYLDPTGFPEIKLGNNDSGEFTVSSTNAATGGPGVTMFADSASPAANDYVGAIRFNGRNSGASAYNYGHIDCYIVDPTAASEDSYLQFQHSVAGAALTALKLGTSGNFQGDPGHVFVFPNSGYLTLQSNDPATNGPGIVAYHNSASPAANDAPFYLDVYGKDSAANDQFYGTIVLNIDDTTNTSEDSHWRLRIKSAGATLDALTLGTTDAFGDFGHVFDGGANSFASVTIKNSMAGTDGPGHYIYHNSASPAANDKLGFIEFSGNNSGAALAEYVVLHAVLLDPTALSEDAKFDISILSGGSSLAALTLGTTVTSGEYGHIANGGTGDYPAFEFKNTSAGSGGTYYTTFQDSASPANADNVGGISFRGRDSAANSQMWGQIDSFITDVTSGSEDSYLNFQVQFGGSSLAALSLMGGGNFQTGSKLEVGSGTSAGLEIRGTDATGAGQTLYIFNDSASPAASDAVGQLWFAGRDSAANLQTYCYMAATILDPTNGSEDSNYTIAARTAGAIGAVLTIGPGLQTGAPTGGDKGAGTHNQTAGYYENGTRVSPGCYGFTTGGGTPSLGANSFNMTSITDTATGRLTCTIATDFADANYVAAFGGTTTNSTTAAKIIMVNSKAAGSFEIDSYSAVTPTLSDIVVGFDWVCFGNRT